MEKKERQKLIKSLDLMNGFPEWKIPCSCPKGGMYEEGSICSKCGGSEWIVNPELVALFEKELDKAREEGIKEVLEWNKLQKIRWEKHKDDFGKGVLSGYGWSNQHIEHLITGGECKCPI